LLYAIICDDVPESLPLRQESRPAHIARLQALQEQGCLVLAGPHPAVDCDNPADAGFSGSLIVAEFPTLEEAEAWAAADPYRSAGVYARVTVKPFKRVFPQ
jgi:uncharacterized protein YciI